VHVVVGGDLVVRSHIIVLLGYLVESFKTAFSEDQVNQLLQLCLNTLEAQLQQPSHMLLAGAMKCLDSLLTWFDDELPARGNNMCNWQLVVLFSFGGTWGDMITVFPCA
jgi:hypothetical protein